VHGGDERRGDAQRTAGLVIGGVGVAIVTTGVILGLAARSTYDESSDFCDASGGCDPPGLDLRESAMRKGNVATAVFGLGAAATIGGGLLWLTAPKSAPHAGVGIGVARDGILVRGAW
jgi:hypothetical protein